jgi:hypothetical protein
MPDSLTESDDYDAHETLKKDEPPFTVQGGDPLAPETVQFWADYARATARAILQGVTAKVTATFEVPQGEDDFAPSEQDKVAADALLRRATAAEQVSWEMLAYQRGDETAPEVRATYSGEPAERSETVETRRTLIKNASRLNNALAEANDVAEALAAIGECPTDEALIRTAVRNLRVAAEGIDPRKPGERS